MKNNEIGTTLRMLNCAVAVSAEVGANDDVMLIVWHLEASRRMEERAVRMKEG